LTSVKTVSAMQFRTKYSINDTEGYYDAPEVGLVFFR
jgi:hypothetical protein